MAINQDPPRLKAPAGTCDTHMHIYDSRYPTAPTASFTPPDASVADYLKVRERLGIARTLVVQPSTYGADNRCTLAAIAALGASARGIAVADQTVTDAELDRLTKAASAASASTCCRAARCPGKSSKRWRRGWPISAGMCSSNSTAAHCPTASRC